MIAGDPERELGAECAARFGGRLPFLLKVLSAEKALSIQVHPSRAQAEAGYAAENARGLAADDPARNYVDDWPKPELLYALTPFEVAAGLRTPADASALLRALGVDELEPLAAALADAVGEDALGAALASVLEWPEPRPLVASVVAACQRLAASDSPFADACAAAVRVAADHPGDVGVVALLLMRHEVLQPGQAVFMPPAACTPTCTAPGSSCSPTPTTWSAPASPASTSTCPSCSGSSTPRSPSPCSPRVPSRTASPPSTPPPRSSASTCINLPASAEAPARPRPGACPAPAPAPAPPRPPVLALPGTGPSILLCLDGTCTLRAASGQELDLTRGDSCFIPFADGPVHATGPARLVQATPGTPPAPRSAAPSTRSAAPHPKPRQPHTPQRSRERAPLGCVFMIVSSFGRYLSANCSRS